jgi:hypothetical protein
MDAHDFLSTVWPEDGLYVIATPVRLRDTGAVVWRHRVFDTIASAAAEAERLSGSADVYYAVHTVAARQVWNPLKKNRKDDTLGAFEVRSHANMAASRAFFMDLDVAPDHPRKYGSATEAVAALRKFCETTGLPRPCIVSSGVGLHIYWIVDQPLPSAVWRSIAERLRAVADKLTLRYDPARITDTSSVLRVPGTLHLKDRENPRLVQVVSRAQIIPGGEFVTALKAAGIRAGISLSAPVRRPRHDDDPLPDLGENVTKIHADRPPPTMEAVLTACAQMRRIHDEQQTISEPEWFQALNVVRFVEDAADWAQRISAGHPGYSPTETTDKFERIQASGIGPTSCAVLEQVCGAAGCEGCRFAGRVKNPIMAARMVDEAPAPAAPAGTVAVDDDEPLLLLPNPPKPFRRTRGGAIVMDSSSKDGDDITITIYENDLYPIRRVTSATEGSERQFWRVTLPREGSKDFVVDADALYDTRKLMLTLANNGVYPTPNNIPNLRDYMIAYIAELQKAADAEPQVGHLGWNDDMTQFILPHGVLCRDGSTRDVTLSRNAERVALNLGREGTKEAQVQALHFYDHPDYIANQFYIMGGLAAPIFHMTGHHGVVSNAVGDPGASKSTSMYTAAAFWGHPKLYPINGTNSGATTRGRNERVATLANLPICVDEITHIPVREAHDLAMNITQPGHRIRLDVTGTERASVGGYKSSIMLTTANASLHELLSHENAGGTAGSMRVFEIRFARQSVHTKWDADDYLLTLERNYGHIGEPFMRYVMAHYDKVHERVRAMMRYVDEKVSISPAERFWSALIATTVVAAGISRKLGLTSWSPEAMLVWALEEQVPRMRDQVVEEYADPTTCLTNYLVDIHGATIVVDSRISDARKALDKPQAGRPPVQVLVSPRSTHLYAQYDVGSKMILMAHKPFKDYCRRNGINWKSVIDELRKDNAEGQSVVVGRARKVLGACTDHARPGLDAHIINAEHPAIADTLLPQWEAKTAEVASSTSNVVVLKTKAAGG